MIFYVKINEQGVKIAVDLHISLLRVDVVLDNTWLKNISKVVTDYGVMSMKFKLSDRKRI